MLSKHFQGSILQSSGTLENNENVANVINKSLNLIQNYQTTCNNSTAKNGASAKSENDASQGNGSSNQSQYQTETAYKKLSFVYADRAYVCARAGNKIYVVQKRITEPPSIGILILVLKFYNVNIISFDKKNFYYSNLLISIDLDDL